MNLPNRNQIRKILEAYSQVKKADCFAEDLEKERERVITEVLEVLESSPYTPEVGDLVETCAWIPGIIVGIDPKNPDDIEVQAFNKLGKYSGASGGLHSVRHCGVHPISTTRAMYLNALGEARLKILWDTTDYSDTTLKAEFENLRKS